MFNMGFTEIIFLAVIALIVIGPKQLPEMARVLARIINELKRATADITGPLMNMRDESRDFAARLQNKINDPLRATEEAIQKEMDSVSHQVTHHQEEPDLEVEQIDDKKPGDS